MTAAKMYGALLLLGAGAAVVLVYYGKKGAVAAVRAVNPVNHDNIFAGGVNAVGGAVSMDHNWTLGGALFDLLHPGQEVAK